MSKTEWHVAKNGSDANAGTADTPFLTIWRAAEYAMPGDTITVHAGIYRERIDPPRGGNSEESRITYQAAPGEEVVVCGSERVLGWQRLSDEVWRVEVSNSLFGEFNPFAGKLSGPWFLDNGRQHHMGAVYLKGHWLTEAASLKEVFDCSDGSALWFAEIEKGRTIIHARFPGVDPNEVVVEINARQSVFYPTRTGIDFIAVKGFKLRHAATPWGAPTCEQIGLIGTNWSKGWLIEDNEISYSICTGISLGKYHDARDFTGEEELVEFSAEKDTFHRTIHHALENDWTKNRIGGHIVRNNSVSHCEMAGIAGAFGAAFCQILGNDIHHIHVCRLFAGFEMAGIKFHGAIDTLIAHNHVHDCYRGLWLDWMTQGTRVSANLFHNNGPEFDIFTEVNHGPFVIDNNVSLSAKSLHDWSEGGLYAHNFFAGEWQRVSEFHRTTPWHEPHSTAVGGFKNIPGGDNRFFNNLILSDASTMDYDQEALAPSWFRGNLYFNSAKPPRCDAAAWTSPNPLKWSLESSPEGVVLKCDLESLPSQVFGMVDGRKTPHNQATQLPFENFDGNPLLIDRDYFDNPRDIAGVRAGPFEKPVSEIALWPKPR